MIFLQLVNRICIINRDSCFRELKIKSYKIPTFTIISMIQITKSTKKTDTAKKRYSTQ